MEMRRLTRDENAEPVSRDQNLRRERGEGNIHFLCSADHEQNLTTLTRLIHTLATCVTIYTLIVGAEIGRDPVSKHQIQPECGE